MDEMPAPFWRRLLWMAAIWAVSVIAVGAFAYALRFLIRL